MSETLTTSPAFTTTVRPPRVLVCCVDDALFGLHLDWVEAVYPRAAVREHSVRTREGQARCFLAHRGEAALVIDLREVFDLQTVLAVPQRAQYLIVRSGSIALALAADACLGIRELELHAQLPVPSTVVRDGGFPVAHIVRLDGRMLAVLDPSHLLEDSARSSLGTMQLRARQFLARQAKLDALWPEICMQPTITNLQAFARLCARNGRARAAAAARLVLKHLTGSNRDDEATSDIDRFIGTLVRLGLERRNGELLLAATDPNHGPKVVFAEGRIIDACVGAMHGKDAFNRLLATRPSEYHFIEADSGTDVAYIQDSTAALAIASLEALGSERRSRAR